MNIDELVDRFNYHPPKDDFTISRHQSVRDYTKMIAVKFNYLLPDGREKALAITKLEEAMYWANAAIARNQEIE